MSRAIALYEVIHALPGRLRLCACGCNTTRRHTEWDDLRDTMMMMMAACQGVTTWVCCVRADHKVKVKIIGMSLGESTTVKLLLEYICFSALLNMMSYFDIIQVRAKVKRCYIILQRALKRRVFNFILHQTWACAFQINPDYDIHVVLLVISIKGQRCKGEPAIGCCIEVVAAAWHSCISQFANLSDADHLSLKGSLFYTHKQ